MKPFFRSPANGVAHARRLWVFLPLLALLVALFAPLTAPVAAQGPVPNQNPTTTPEGPNGTPSVVKSVDLAVRPATELPADISDAAHAAVNGGATPSAVTNLIVNPGFEADANTDGRPDGWTPNINATRTSVQKRVGTYAIRHQATNNISYGVGQTLTNVVPGTGYNFGAWVNIPATTDAFAFRIDILWRNGTTQLGVSQLKNYTAATAGWQHALTTVTPPANTTNAVVRMVVSSLNATIYVDEIVLQAAPKGAFFYTKDFKTISANIAVDARGGTHLAFNKFSSYNEHPAAYYVYCPPPASGCTNYPTNWRGVFMSDYVDEVQLVLSPAGQPRLLIGKWHEGFNSDEYLYAECNSVCYDATRAVWKGLVVAQPGGIDVFMNDNPQHSFALDPQGRPRFVYTNGWGNGRPTGVYYTYCQAHCTNAGTWFETQIYQGPEFNSLAFDYPSLKFTTAGQPRLVANMSFSGDDQGVMYLQCDTGCGALAGWKAVKLYDRGGGVSAGWDLELDSSNRPRVAFYQAGFANGSGDQLFYAWCNANCLTATNWQRKAIGLSKLEGNNPDLELDAQGRPRIVYEDYWPVGNVPGLGYAWCNTACESTTGVWQRKTIEPSSVLNTAFPVPQPFTCDKSAWLGAIPSLALDAAGDPRIAYDALNVATCHYTDTSGNHYTRVEKLWRAVRVNFTPQP